MERFIFTDYGNDATTVLCDVVDQMQHSKFGVMQGFHRVTQTEKILGSDRHIIGSGYYAMAFQYGMTKVFKTNCAAFEIEEDAQARYLMWCTENQDKSWVPKIDFLLVDPATGEYFVVMEKLYSFSDMIRRQAPVDFRKIERLGLSDVGNLIANWITEQRPEYQIEIAREADKDLKKLKKFGVEFPAIVDFFSGVGDGICYRLSAFEKSHNCWLDLHDDNYMLRNSKGKQYLVMTDPFTSK